VVRGEKTCEINSSIRKKEKGEVRNPAERRGREKGREGHVLQRREGGERLIEKEEVTKEGSEMGGV